MTYKTRQEVLRAAADWMDVCNCAGVVASFKYGGVIHSCVNSSFFGDPKYYEFPISLLEGKEVWVGSELYEAREDGVTKFVACGLDKSGHDLIDEKRVVRFIKLCSWNPPKPKTVMVEMLVEDAEYMSNRCHATDNIAKACKKALEKL